MLEMLTDTCIVDRILVTSQDSERPELNVAQLAFLNLKQIL